MLDLKAKILIVDDEIDNLDILHHILEKEGYGIIRATNGKEALLALEHHDDIDVIVLDRLMPVMDGMSFLARVKASPQWAAIPVIMQTAAAAREQIEEGLQAGVYYYLTKPYSRKVLLAIVKSALDDKRMLKNLYRESERLSEKAREIRRGLSYMYSSLFHYKTVRQAKRIAAVISSCFPRPREVVLGFTELMVNAVEHGNLGIPFQEKKEHLINGTWEDELEFRLSQAQYKAKVASVTLTRTDREIAIEISDEGEGFDWRKFLTIDPTRADAPNGRGIFLAQMDFDHLQYIGNGSTVVCRKRI